MDVVLHPQLLKTTSFTSHTTSRFPMPPAEWQVKQHSHAECGTALPLPMCATSFKRAQPEPSPRESDSVAMGCCMSISASGGPDVFRPPIRTTTPARRFWLRDDGSIPPDNPFVNKPGYKPGIYTLGHRNGHSMSLNPETGQFWMTEQGPNGGDEVNILKPGANYGWPFVSKPQLHGPEDLEVPYQQGTEQPHVVWVPSIAVAGGTFYTGEVFTGWKRSYFVGGLREVKRRAPGNCSASSSTTSGRRSVANRCCGSCISESETSDKGRTDCFTS